MKKNKIHKEIILNFLITLSLGLISLLVNKYFANYLDIKNLGLMKLFTQLLSYLNLAELGVASASTYALYKPLLEKDEKQISIIMNTLKILYNRIFIVILIGGILLNPVIPFFIKNQVKDQKIYLYWSLYVVSSACSYIFAKYMILLMADQKYKVVRLIQGGSKIFCQLCQILVIIKYKSFVGFISLIILENIIQFTFYRLYYKKYYNYIFKIKEKNDLIIKNLKKLFWHKIAGLAVFNTDLILISKFISLEMSGIYSSYQMVVQMVATIPGIGIAVLIPKIGKYIAENTKSEIYTFFKKLNICFLFISLFFSLCTYRMIGDFIILWLGKDFILSPITIFLIIINLFIKCFRSILDTFKDGSGFFDDIHLPILEALINLLISVTLVFYLGLNGVIIGTIISNILIIIIAKPILVFKECFNLDIKEYIKVYGSYLILILLSIYISNEIFKFISLKIINNWLDWICQSIVIAILYFIIIFVIFLSNKEFRKILKKTT